MDLKSRIWYPQSAFTFIEFIMVIVVLLIIAAIVIPKISGVTGTRVNSAARKIAADIRYAQQLAITTQIRHGVIFNPEFNNYSIYQTKPINIIFDPFKGGSYTIQLNNGEYEGVTIDSKYQVEFDALGNPVIGGGGSVTISASGSAPVRVISVATNTGRVSIN